MVSNCDLGVSLKGVRLDSIVLLIRIQITQCLVFTVEKPKAMYYTGSTVNLAKA